MLHDYLGPLGSIVPHPDVAPPFFEILRLKQLEGLAVKTEWYLIGGYGPFLTMSHPETLFHVGVAQWTEQEISNLPVAGSNPSVGSIIAG